MGQTLDVLMDTHGIAALLGVSTDIVADQIRRGNHPPAVMRKGMSRPRWGYSSIPAWLSLMNNLGVRTSCGPPPRDTRFDLYADD